jgi:hypothetical protein
MSPHAFWALLWGTDRGVHEVRVGSATCWIPCARPRPFGRLLTQDDVMVNAVPRTAPDAYALGPAWVLWARLERPACATLLGRLPVGPTLVLREGSSSRRTALWALSEPLDGDWITRATERLAHHLEGRRGAADASALIPSPFTRITVGRVRPSQIRVEYESEEISTARQIVGRLRDAPSTDGWRQAA